jgi:hypothetical protein
MRNSVFFAALLTLAACTDPGGTGLSDTPKIIVNALTPSAFAGSLLSSNQLTSTSAATMGATANGRSVLEFAVGCALSNTQSISYTVSGTTYSATGLMGIATGWTSGAMSATDAAWVSACVVSRVNLTGATVTISARGGNAGLDTINGEAGNYMIEEGAFWGNVFGNLGTVAGNACDGVDQANNDTYGDLPLRECAEPGLHNTTPCGFNYRGLCDQVCSSGAAPYDGCPVDGGAVDTVVTTFLYGLPLY